MCLPGSGRELPGNVLPFRATSPRGLQGEGTFEKVAGPRALEPGQDSIRHQSPPRERAATGSCWPQRRHLPPAQPRYISYCSPRPLRGRHHFSVSALARTRPPPFPSPTLTQALERVRSRKRALYRWRAVLRVSQGGEAGVGVGVEDRLFISPFY